jgi:arginyl-tRNA synthetase
VKRARLALADAVRQVLRNGLALLGVSAPDRM